ncbi:MAG: electron transfer flavoprotein subunit alpha/FixB family protein [Deltaproteobacteria bacterium]|nr:electron transfer flavoprotein subunit alpha/FixB family protein [Deltaproteobacteria bacterium]
MAKKSIWVFVEQRHGCLAEVGLELLGKARALAEPLNWQVTAVLLGHELRSLADQVLWYGPDEVLVSDSLLLADYCNQAYVAAIAGAIKEFQPEVLLIGATAMGTDLAPRLAARLRTGLSAHCIDLDLTAEGGLLSIVPGWGGNILAQITCPRTRPQMATVMPGVFAVPEAGQATGTVRPVLPQVKPEDVTYRIVETKREEAPKSGLETAEVVVAGGWGVGNKANWSLIQGLAEVLNAAVGATRPPVDEGWAEESQMIGQSGRTVHPRLYVGVGISGHMHHLVGLKSVELMIGINGDPKAPIFEHCHLGLVGDLKEIVPALTKAIRAYSDPTCL